MLRQSIKKEDLDLTICRYFELWKFEKLIADQALWLSQLKHLTKIDPLEGEMPIPVRRNFAIEHNKLKSVFPEELHSQIEGMSDRNVLDGLELTVANSWFLGGESLRMWKEYVKEKEGGVAVTSTICKLDISILTRHAFHLQIGKVRYVDMTEFEMGAYLGNQAIERAFIKSQALAHENEVRIAAMNLRVPGCVENGKILTAKDCAGVGMNNHRNKGLNIRIDLATLIDSIILSPNATSILSGKIEKLLKTNNLSVKVKRSQFE